MKEKNALFLIKVLRGTINVYFDIFFVFYFYKATNYEVYPLAKYFLSLYLFAALGFFLVRKAMKKNIRAPYFRIGISLQAVFIALIMLLKEKIVDYILLIGFIRGIANGFYFFPKNIFGSEKVPNEERQKFEGLLNIVTKIISIFVPLILGAVLTYMNYTDLGKIFFMLFIVMFILSFYIKDSKYIDKKFDIKAFFKVVKQNKNVKNSLITYFTSGLTYSSGVMGIIITLSQIHFFKTNLNLGFVESLCAVLYLITGILYTSKLKKEYFRSCMLVSGIISFVSLMLFAFKPSIITLITYLIVRSSFIGLIQLVSTNVTINISNTSSLKEDFKAEFYLMRDLLYSLSRCLGYLILLIVSFCFGMSYIYYILVISAISLLTESFLVAKLSRDC